MTRWPDHPILSPAALLQHIGFRHCGDCQPFHCADAVLAGFEQNLRIIEVRSCTHDGAGANLGFFCGSEVDGIGHKYARAYEYGFGAELAYECRVGGSSNAPCRKVRNGELSAFADHAY